MNTPALYYAIPLFIGAAVAMMLAGLAWQRRLERGAATFTLTMLAIAAWSLAYGFEILAPDLAGKLIWHKIIYTVAPTVPIFWLLFMLQQKLRSQRLLRWITIGLIGEVMVFIFLTWTNDTFHLLWIDIAVSTGPELAHLEIARSPGFYVQTGLGYVLILLATGLMLHTLRTGVPLPRWQIALLCFAILSPIIANVLYVSGWNPFYPLNFTPFALITMGLGAGWYLFRFRVWDLLPVARNALVASMNDGVIVLDRHNRVLDLNPAAQRLLNLTLTSSVGQALTVVLPDAAQFGSLHACLAAAQTPSNPSTHAHSIELELIKPEWRYLDLRMSQLYSGQYRGQRHISGLLVTMRDISARKRAEQALAAERSLLAQHVAERTADLSAANRRLIQAALLKDEFLATMSHELRTPLHTILSITEALQATIYGELNSRQDRALQHIDSSGRHLLALINDILDLSIIGAGQLQLELAPVAIEAVCQASLNAIKQAAFKRKLAVIANLDLTVGTIQADERRVRQLLLNLLNNAVKFTPPGGKVGLDLAGDCQAHVVRFTVWDTGIGIAPEDVNRLFQPFVQLDSSLTRRYEGSGLGLSIVARMVHLMGGTVTVESEVNQGSRFCVTLPLASQNSGNTPG